MTYGGSTGGWESLAWQIFYPDRLNGVWSFCPDPVDFSSFQAIDIYNDDNAFYPNSEWKKTPVRPVEPRPRRPDVPVAVRRQPLRGGARHARALGRADGHLHGRVRPGRPGRLSEAALRQVDGRHRSLRGRVLARALRPAPHPRARLEDAWARSSRASSTSSSGDQDTYLLEEAAFKLQRFLEGTKDPPYGGTFDDRQAAAALLLGHGRVPGPAARAALHPEDDRADADDRAGRARISAGGTDVQEWRPRRATMERKKASDFDPEVLILFDAYVHGAHRPPRVPRARREVRRRRRDGRDAARRAEPEVRRGAAGGEGRQADHDRVPRVSRRRRATRRMRGYLVRPAEARRASCRACW